MRKDLSRALGPMKFANVSQQRSRNMSAIRSRKNKTTEQRLRLSLVRAGIAGWTMNPPGIAGCPDFYFPILRVAIFVDGCFWHACPECGHLPKTRQEFWATKFRANQERDRRVTELLQTEGIRVARFWEHEIQNELSKCLSAIRQMTNPRNYPKSISCRRPL
jgi:DNA mismatch endonuclease Vsr